ESAAIAHALEVSRESLATLQRMQEQTAQLHRQFLEGQELAHRTVHLLVEQQQRLFQHQLGVPGPLSPPAAAFAPAPELPTPPRSIQRAVAQPSPAATANAPGYPAPTSNIGVGAVASSPKPKQQAPDKVQRILFEIIAEKTGYPAEMLGLDMTLDSDLGI